MTTRFASATAALLSLAVIVAACGSAATPEPRLDPDQPVSEVPGSAGPIDPGAPSPSLVLPDPSAVDAHAVTVEALSVGTAGDGRVVATLAWWSGVEPCSLLQAVLQETDGTTITLTVLEGRTPEADVACIEIAVWKGTQVDLGELAPGTWTVVADPATAEPVTITVG